MFLLRGLVKQNRRATTIHGKIKSFYCFWKNWVLVVDFAHAGAVIWPYIFRSEYSQQVTVKSERYRIMITDFLASTARYNLDSKMARRATQQVIHWCCKKAFRTRYFGENWCQMPAKMRFNALRPFLWIYAKSLAYISKPKTPEQLGPLRM